MKSIAPKQLRSDCPASYFFELFGDKWSLLIVRDIAFWGKVSHSEFRESDEHIATNILADRLAKLIQHDIIVKTADTEDGRRDNYALTANGLALIPILLDINVWSAAFGPTQLFTSRQLLTDLTTDRTAVISKITTMIEQGSYVFAYEPWQPHRNNKTMAAPRGIASLES